MKLRGAILVIAMLLGAIPAHAVYLVGEDVESFTLDTPEGVPVSLSDFFGDVILINFFATW